eukprot:3240073-Amphidinium_carterae.1
MSRQVPHLFAVVCKFHSSSQFNWSQVGLTIACLGLCSSWSPSSSAELSATGSAITTLWDCVARPTPFRVGLYEPRCNRINAWLYMHWELDGSIWCLLAICTSKIPSVIPSTLLCAGLACLEPLLLALDLVNAELASPLRSFAYMGSLPLTFGITRLRDVRDVV